MSCSTINIFVDARNIPIDKLCRMIECGLADEAGKDGGYYKSSVVHVDDDKFIVLIESSYGSVVAQCVRT